MVFYNKTNKNGIDMIRDSFQRRGSCHKIKNLSFQDDGETEDQVYG